MVDRAMWPNLSVVIARSTQEAKNVLELLGTPMFMALDHDLGGHDTTMKFLKWFAFDYEHNDDPVPEYVVHSANPAGTQNIISYIESWRRSREIHR